MDLSWVSNKLSAGLKGCPMGSTWVSHLFIVLAHESPTGLTPMQLCPMRPQ